MDDETRKSIGQRIAQVRKHLGLKQSDVAAALGIGRTHVTNFESGETVPVYLLHWLISTHNVSLDWLITGHGEMFVNIVRYEKDIQNLLEDFQKCPELKHRVLSDFFTIRDRYIKPVGARKSCQNEKKR